MIDNIKRKNIFLLVVLSLVTSTGCTLLERDKNYNFRPSVSERAAGSTEDLAEIDPHSITDHHILAFTNQVRNALRQRMNFARLARSISGTVQVLTAASAAALSGFSGGSAIAIASLAGTSAIIPELQEIFDAKDRAVTYQQGVALIEQAEGRYLKKLSASTQAVTNGRLSPAGAELYFEVVSSIKLVEIALSSQIPDIKDLENANGILHNTIKVVPDSLILQETDTTTFPITSELVLLKNGPAVSIVSSDFNVVEASISPTNQYVINVTTKKIGDAFITITNGEGESVSVLVKAANTKSGTP